MRGPVGGEGQQQQHGGPASGSGTSQLLQLLIAGEDEGRVRPQRAQRRSQARTALLLGREHEQAAAPTPQLRAGMQRAGGAQRGAQSEQHGCAAPAAPGRRLHGGSGRGAAAGERRTADEHRLGGHLAAGQALGREGSELGQHLRLHLANERRCRCPRPHRGSQRRVQLRRGRWALASCQWPRSTQPG